MTDLSRLYAAIEGRTPGPWEIRPPAYGTMYVPYITDANGGRLAETTHHGRMLEDARFIALMGTCADEIAAVLRATDRFIWLRKTSHDGDEIHRALQEYYAAREALAAKVNGGAG